MERLMTLKLEVQGCVATVRINDFPVATAAPGATVTHVPVHEYTVNGSNHVEMTVRPTGKPLPPGESVDLVLPQDALAMAHVLLPRIGQEAGEHAARSLAQVEWSAPKDTRVRLPLKRMADVDLPVSFPVWRWAKAPPAEASEELRQLAFSTLDEVAGALSAGDPEPFLNLTRLRCEEVAQAYQRDPGADQQRLRTQLLAWHEAGGLKWEARDLGKFRLQPVADGRLLECVDDAGLPALRTQPDADGIARSFPLRFACVAGKIYVLR